MRIDYIITHDGRVHTGLLGGNALYSAVGAALWANQGDNQVGLWAKIGENFPREWLAQLADFNLETTGLIRAAGDQDHRTFFAYTPDGRRDDTNPAGHFARLGRPLPPALAGYIHSTLGQDDPDIYEPLALRPGDWPESYRGAAAVHLAPLSIRTHTQVPVVLRRQGIQIITVDPGERYMRPELIPAIRQFMPHVHAFLPSVKEIRSLFGEEIDLGEAAETLAGWGAPIVVIKHGREGVLIYERDNRRKTHLPAYHPQGDGRIVDVTGAGDAFCGGFLVGLNQSGDPVQAAQMGLVSASLVLEGYGALYALSKPAEEVQSRWRMNHYPPLP
jgi:sugar/nucleoside kinase (ribokinase family)